MQLTSRTRIKTTTKPISLIKERDSRSEQEVEVEEDGITIIDPNSNVRKSITLHQDVTSDSMQVIHQIKSEFKQSEITIIVPIWLKYRNNQLVSRIIQEIIT